MKNRVVRRLAALLMSVAMLVSGLTFAEAAEVTSEPAAQAGEQIAVVSEDLAANETNITVPELGAPIMEVPAADGAAAPETAGEADDAASAQGGETGDVADSAAEGAAAGEDGSVAESSQEENTDSGLETADADADIMLTAEQAACSHEWVEQEERIPTGIASVGPKGHKCIYKVTTYEMCFKCGMIKKDTYKDAGTVTDTAEQSHTWLSGRCLECGYECTHANASGDWKIEETATTYACWDENSCQPTYLYYRQISCPDCGYKREIDEFRLGDPVPHYYDGTSMCLHCRYRPSLGMTHQHTWVADSVEEGYESYKPNGDQCIAVNHKTTTNYVCSYSGCGVKKTETVVDQQGAFPVAHEFSMGVCVNCGYQSGTVCNHPNLERVSSEQSSYASFLDPVTYNGDHTHTVLTLMSNHYYCPDCGFEYTLNEKVENTSDCQFVTNADGSHTCTVCGFTYSCEHPNLKTSGTKLEDRVTYSEIPGDDTNHTKVTEQGWECPDCHAKVYPKEDAKTEQVAHSWKDGVCTVEGCGHKCSHAGKIYDRFPDMTPESVADNDNTHTTTLTTIPTWSCACGVSGADEPDVQTYTDQNHLYIKGVCSECGHTCEHGDGGKVYGETVTESYTTTDAAHIPVQVRPWTCSYCKATGEDKLPQGEPVKHTYEKTGDTYTCSVCQHVCTHESTTKTDGEAKEPTWKTAASGHTKQYKVPVTITCDYCGYATTVDEDRADAEQPHTWDAATGKCSVCGYACEHTDCDTAVNTEWEPFKADGDATHSRTGVKTTTTTCKTCGYKTVETEEVAETELAHNYVDGVCTDCEHACEHSGEMKAQAPVTEDAKKVEVEGDDAAHKLVGTRITKYACAYCGEIDESKTLIEEDFEGTEEHTYVDGVCSVCGHVCAHSGEGTAQEPVIEITKREEIKGDDAQHKTVGTKTTKYACAHCGKIDETETLTETYEGTEEHTYVDGVCTVCGHECAHSGEGTAQEPVIEITEREEIEGDDAQHKTVGTKTTKYACTHCGEIDESETDSEPYEGTEAHSYVDGVCTDCGHECAHSGDVKAQAPVTDITGRNEIPGDDTQHRIVGTTTTQYACEHCGEIVEDETETEPYESTEAHSYVGGVCTICGHWCGHSDRAAAQVTDQFVPDGVYTPNGTAGHLASGHMLTVVKCNSCGETWNAQGAELVSVLQEHVYENGVCTVCGFVRPVVNQPTAQPVPQDEPVFEEVAPNEVVHNVSTSDGLRMATALGTAIEGIQAEYGANVSIVVNHAEEVLSATEYATMTKLPAVEQMMVVLCALGYSDEVQNGLSEMGIVLSDEAAALIEEIQQSLQSMSSEELAQYQAALNEFFAEIGGTNAQHTQITLELRVKLPDGYRTERYGFELKDGAWYFTKLSVAGA